MRSALIGLGILLLIAVVAVWIAGTGFFGEVDGEGTSPKGVSRDATVVAQAVADQQAAARAVAAPSGEQILFGDFHVHTTLSGDAFVMNLPLMGGAGALSPADACDFARHCAALDFWSINDHANSIYPEDWTNTVAAIRECNAKSGDPSNPDTVAFLGWEWTQAGLTPDGHYGHKNVVLAHTDDERIPTRPIGAKPGSILLSSLGAMTRGALSFVDDRFDDLNLRIASRSETPVCGDGHVTELGTDCQEVAPTPADLYRKLDEWGHDAIVIPHGTAWGIYTPPNSSWDKQLEGDMHDPDRQTLLEVYSGHGDSEVYRSFRGFEISAAGHLVCPEETPGYLPPCRQAGRIVMQRCLGEGTPELECEGRAELARQHAMKAGKDYVATIENGDAREWLDAGMCRDCDQPSFSYVPTGSAQYIAALGNFDEDPNAPRRFRMGFMASSDNHSARPGTGYKELLAMTDGGFDHPESASALVDDLRSGPGEDAERPGRSRPIDPGATSPLTALADSERAGSFQYTGGLVAVHAPARDRDSIWGALERRETYGTSGPRILLWFDLLTEEGERPMGTEIELAGNPTFRVRAVGSREQQAGCPQGSLDSLGPEELERLCLGECHHPGDARRAIERIDVIRVRPQIFEGEDVGSLVDDPWRSFECDGDPAGCVATFTDEAFQSGGRDAVYYARVYEPEKPTANGDPLNCERDEAGRCLAVNTCDGSDDCLAPDRPRAWSSPIYVDHPSRARSR
ncbi:MAG: DUF3604 domain-containing protein [bacterium]|nr:DUF3604 domain-containing protein [bacterium]